MEASELKSSRSATTEKDNDQKARRQDRRYHRRDRCRNSPTSNPPGHVAGLLDARAYLESQFDHRMRLPAQMARGSRGVPLRRTGYEPRVGNVMSSAEWRLKMDHKIQPNDAASAVRPVGSDSKGGPSTTTASQAESL